MPPQEQFDSQMTAKRHGEYGFTLIETVIAMLLLMIVSLGAASLFFYAAQNSTGGEGRTQSLAVAESIMEDYRAAEFSDDALAATTSQGVQQTITYAGRSFVATTVVTDVSPTLKAITIRVRPRDTAPGWTRAEIVLTTRRSSSELGEYFN